MDFEKNDKTSEYDSDKEYEETDDKPDNSDNLYDNFCIFLEIKSL